MDDMTSQYKGWNVIIFKGSQMLIALNFFYETLNMVSCENSELKYAATLYFISRW